MRLPPAPRLLLALLFLLAVPASAAPLRPQYTLVATPALAADPPTQTVDVTITASGADPQTITVTAGTAVRWRNSDSIAHTITSDDGSFGPFSLENLDTATYLFDAAGTYSYTISAIPAAGSAGTIVVTAGTPAATATPTETASPSSTPSATTTTSPTPSATPSTAPTFTPSATATASPSTTPTASTTATATASPTATATQTGTPTSTATATATSLPPDTVPVTIADAAFVPQVITVTAGMYVQWTNVQPIAVAITSTSGLIGSNPIPPGGSYRMRFAQLGAYEYNLAGSNGFTGSVVVLPAPSPTAGETATASPTVSATSSATATASPTASATGSATPTATGAATSTASPTGAAATATATPADTLTSSPSATPANTPTQSPTASPRPSNTPTVPPVFRISLSGAVPSPCAPSIPVGSAVTWTDDNPLGGPSYYLQGISPPPFSGFSARLDPGSVGQPNPTVLFTNAGTYIYSITSTASTAVVQATITVSGAIQPCPMPTETASPSATPTSTPTPSATVSPRLSNTPTAPPTSSPSATPTASATITPTHTPTPTATATWTATPTSTPAPAARPAATQAPPAAAGSVPAPSPVVGTVGATPTRAASAVKPTPAPTPRRSSTPAASRRQNCLVAVPRHAVGAVTVNGYARHGHARVDLAMALPIPLSTSHSTLRLHDPVAHLALTASHITHVRLVCTDLRVDGLVRIGKRAIPFRVEIHPGQHGFTLTASVPARHYRLGGAFHGHLAMRLTHKPPHKQGTNKRSSGSGRPAGHGGKKTTAHGGKH